MATVEVKDAIFEVLEADATVSGFGPVYNGRVPDGVDPGDEYYVVGDATEIDSRLVFQRVGDENTIEIKAWARQRTVTEWWGRTKAEQMIAAVLAAIRANPLVVAGHDLVHLRRELSLTLPDPDTDKVQGLLRLRVVTRSS